jgi:hypothetical protein
VGSPDLGEAGLDLLVQHDSGSESWGVRERDSHVDRRVMGIGPTAWRLLLHFGLGRPSVLAGSTGRRRRVAL